MKLSTHNLYGRYAVPKICDFLPNMLAPPSEVEVSHKTNLKSLAHLQPAQIGIFLIARLSDIWGSDGPYGAQMILRDAKMSQLSLRAQMGQFGAQMSQLGAQMGQLGSQRGQ